MHIKAAGFTPDELDGFRAAQRRSFSILTEVADTVQEGWSERAAVKLLFEGFADIGVDRFFHVPVALFGARTHWVDRDLAQQGLTNCHRLHPEAVLGHRVLLLADDDNPPPVDGFHPEVLAWFRSEIHAGASEPLRTPTWNETAGSDHAPTAGLWAVEPHIARDGIGVKWEEILVIDDDGRAQWLDDAVPHLTSGVPA